MTTNPTIDPLLEELDFCRRGLILARRRLPLWRAIVRELEAVREALASRHPGQRFSNDHPLLQLIRDCYDMLVIELYSVRSRLVRGKGGADGKGLLFALEFESERLKRATPEEFPPVRGVVSGGNLTPEQRERFLQEASDSLNARVAKGINDTIDRMFGPGEVTRTAVERFRTDLEDQTQPLKKARDNVHAHRYEPWADPTYFLDHNALEKQMELLETAVVDLGLILTRASYSLDLQYSHDTDRAAEDVADIVVHGSINAATLAYGLVPERGTPEDPKPWYWIKRKVYVTGKED